MGKASSSKKVARAARAGGRGRATGRSLSSFAFPVIIGSVVVLGVLLIALSRGDDAEATPPTLSDHWHAAYGIWACDRWLPPLLDENDPQGIHSHADGVIHIHPFSNAVTGDRATLEPFVDAIGMELDDDRLEVPDVGTFREGETDCDGEDGVLRVVYWEDARSESDEPTEVFTGNLSDVRLTDSAAYAIVFAPEDVEVPKPPTVPNLDRLEDVPQQQQAPPGDTTGDTTENTDTTTGSETTEAP